MYTSTDVWLPSLCWSDLPLTTQNKAGSYIDYLQKLGHEAPGILGQKAIPPVVAGAGISAGEEVPLPTPRTQVVRGTVLQQCARNALQSRSDLLSRPAS